MLPSGLNVRYIVLLCLVHSSTVQRLEPYTSHSLPLKRFVFRKVEASDWWWTARDHGKGTDGRRSDVSPVVFFPPSFARTFSSRERETSGYEAVPVTSEEATGLHDAPSQRDKEHILERQNHKVILEKADLPPIADILIHMNLRWLGHVERVDFARLPRQLLYS